MAMKRSTKKAEETTEGTTQPEVLDGQPDPAEHPKSTDVEKAAVKVPRDLNDGGGDPADGGGNVHLFTPKQLQSQLDKKAKWRHEQYEGHGNGDGYGNPVE